MRFRQNDGGRRVTLIGVVATALLGIAGCASERHVVPDSASVKAAGNDRIVYVADSPGNVWVADKDRNSVAYSGRLRTGDRIVVDNRNRLITVNDRPVVTKDLPQRDYRIFFDSGGAVPAAASITDEQAKAELKRPNSVPLSADIVGEGRDRLEYTAAADGDVWIVNSDRNTLVYSGHVMRGEQVVVDPKQDRLSIGTRSGLTDRANLPDDNYRIFFTPSSERPAAALPASPGTGATPRSSLTPAPAAPLAVTPGSITARQPVAVIERPANIPAGAVVWSDSKDRTNLTATDAGTAWVVDDSNRIIYSTRLVKGDTLAIDPTNDQITLNGNRAYDGKLSAGRYRVFFDKLAR